MNKTLLFIGLGAIVCYTSCKTKKEEKEETGKYTVTSPLKVDTSFTKEYVSQVKSVRNIEIRAQEKGFLENIYVDEGQYVKAGQLLFRIMPKIYEADLMKAQAQAKEASIELSNTRILADKNVVSKNELAMAQAKLDEANAEVTLAKVHLSFTEIRAPFDGTIDRLPLKQGSLVDESELLTTLSDNRQVFAYFNVSEPEYLDYKAHLKDHNNTEATLLLANNQPLPYKGVVETIESEFNSETGNIAFRAKFPNPDGLLKHGETGKVQMKVPLSNALVIPQKATYEIQDKIYVFVVDKNGTVKSRNITITGEMPDLYVVNSGLTENDQIMVEGVQNVKDDSKIVPVFVAPREIVSNLRLKAE
ncbi:efflux RND transporter periplasmic adaptor subunit [Ferruginibacter sp. HRS2-29]|uniref:efflux RND transporter periplasmic adaptor subunit n=1 Tax=Ferruginibacter sp. HRS2-29 TaxID=2487334 RepID=UPI0020CF7DFF|nr:efflux RND transporter periplasmic adaptor subunit [Ferruginibacter sp. HRS2-29]MCP9752621.1 efflux RND transporter periplasmic adaptor subunit [Ferruginibacter sp. HRS2-29]